MGVEQLSNILFRERDLLELLLFKLHVEQLLVSSGRSRWLPAAVREVESVLDEIRRTELTRAVEADQVAEGLGLASLPSLKALAAACEEPWRTHFTDHLQAFLTLTAEITELTTANKELLAAGQRATRDALLSLSFGAQTYSPSGEPVTTGTYHRLIDQSM
jgi:hypothetical protein